MTAEEYIKEHISGQGGFESVPVDVALYALDYARYEAIDGMLKDALDGEINMKEDDVVLYQSLPELLKKKGLHKSEKVKVIIIKKE